MFVEIISAILHGGFVLFLVSKSISASINGMAEAAKDSSERTNEQLQEIHTVLDPLHTVFGGRLYQRDETDKYTDGPTIQELLRSVDKHLEAIVPEQPASVKLIHR
jgi:hypothetical protein